LKFYPKIQRKRCTVVVVVAGGGRDETMKREDEDMVRQWKRERGS
jgi:hypothetical protein